MAAMVFYNNFAQTSLCHCRVGTWRFKVLFFFDFLMGSKGFGKVPASKWCKMQQNQWFSLFFQGFTKQNDRISWKVLEGNQVELIKNTYIYIIYVFLNDFLNDFLWFPRVFARFQPPSVAKCSKNIC